MDTKFFWENVNKRMKYERSQRVQRRRKAGVRPESKSSQMDSEKQLQIESVLQVLEEYVTASLSQPDENYDIDRLSEDIDVISIAVQKLKKDMAADMLVSAEISSEPEHTSDAGRPGLQIVMKVLDDLADGTTIGDKHGEHESSSPLHLKGQELEENKENSTNLVRAQQQENLEDQYSESGSNIPSSSTRHYCGDTAKVSLMASTKDASDLTHERKRGSDLSSVDLPQLFSIDIDVAEESASRVTKNEEKAKVVGFQDHLVLVDSQGEPRKTLEGIGNVEVDDVENNGIIAHPVEEMLEVVQNVSNDGLGAESAERGKTSDLITGDIMIPKNDPAPLEESETTQKRDTFRLMKPKFGMKRNMNDKPSIWARKLTARSQEQNFSQLEKDMRKEKPKFNVNGDKLLQKAISSLKKNLRQQPLEEGPNPEPLPPKLLNAADFLESAETYQP